MAASAVLDDASASPAGASIPAWFPERQRWYPQFVSKAWILVAPLLLAFGTVALSGCGLVEALGRMGRAKSTTQASGSEKRTALESCAPGEVRYGNDCLDVAVELHGMRLEVPCKGQSRGRRCLVSRRERTVTSTLLGNLAEVYEVELRVRGVIEQQRYVGGTLQGDTYLGGEPRSKQASLYRLEISEPEATIFLNLGDPRTERVVPVDFTVKVLMNGAAKVNLTVDTRDWRHLANRGSGGKAVIVEDVPPAPEPFNGQFLQLDVVSIKVVE